MMNQFKGINCFKSGDSGTSRLDAAVEHLDVKIGAFFLHVPAQDTLAIRPHVDQP